MTPRAKVFASGERHEFIHRDYGAAIVVYESLLSDSDSAVRAGAHLRIGRVHRKAGNPAQALIAYRSLSTFDSESIEEVPAGLLGQLLICRLFAELGEDAEVQSRGAALLADLYSGRWPITGSVYSFYEREARQLLDDAGGRPHASGAQKLDLELSAAIDMLWQRVQGAPDATLAPPFRIETSDHDFIIMSVAQGTDTAFLVAGPAFVERHWGAPLAALAARLDTSIAMVHPRDLALTTRIAGRQLQAVRTSDQTGLPWAILVTSADLDAERARLGGRRPMFIGALVLGALFLSTGTYFVGRSVAKEARVARLQSDFVATVSHEFRSPLTSMRHLTEMLVTGRVTDEEQRLAFYSTLAQESERLQDLVERLLDFHRIEEGVVRFEFEELGVFSFLHEVADAFRKEIAGSGYELKLLLKARDQRVRADRAALARALRNLLENAVAYSPDCKTVWLEFDLRDAGVAISVRDEGVGIPKDERQTIFHKFVRGAASRSLHRSGTGLGLAMVAEIVKAHDGELLLDTEPNKGSTFTIVLPQASD